MVVELARVPNVHCNKARSEAAGAVTIGAFDGVHLGHQALIKRAIAAAREHGLTSIVYTFDTPPKVYFGKALALTSLEQRIERIAKLCPDRLIIAKFDAEYVTRPANMFIEELRLLGARKIFVGSDFQFGSGQSGNIELLSRHFDTHVVQKTKCREGYDVSSTRIRSLRSRGELAAAAALEGGDTSAFRRDLAYRMPA